MRVLRITVRALSALAALGTAVAIGFGINSLSHVGMLNGCNSPNYSVESCPPNLIVSYAIDPTVPDNTIAYYIATLVLLAVVIALITLFRNVVGTAIAAGLTVIAGPLFLFGQFWYFDIEPGFFAAGTWVADVLGFVTWLIITVLLVLEVLHSHANSGGREVHANLSRFSPSVSRH